MKLSSSRYTYSHPIIGFIILSMGLTWTTIFAYEYYYSNIGMGQLCRIYAPNHVLFIQMVIGALSIVLSVLVIENRLKPLFGTLLHITVMIIGINVVILSEPF